MVKEPHRFSCGSVSKGKCRRLRPDQKKINQGHFDARMSGAAKMLPTMFDYQPPNRKSRLHQAEKPSDLLVSIIEHVTKPGEIIIDQFAGSGNLGKACLKTGRIGILFEILKENIEKIKDNIGAFELTNEPAST